MIYESPGLIALIQMVEEPLLIWGKRGGISFLMSVSQLVLYNGFQKGVVKISGEVPQVPIFGTELNFQTVLFFLVLLCFLTVIAAVLMLLRSNAGRKSIIIINVINTIILFEELIPLANYSHIFNQANLEVFLFCFLHIVFYIFVTILLFRRKEEFMGEVSENEMYPNT